MGGAPPGPPRRPRAAPGCSPNTRMFLPDGSLDLARVDTSLKIEDLRRQRQEWSARDRPGPLGPPLPVNVCPRSCPLRPAPCPAAPSAAPYAPHHRLWPSSSSLVRSPAAATAGPLEPSSSFFSTPTGAILPTAATKRALPRARRGPARTPAGPRRSPATPQTLRCPARPDGPAMSVRVCGSPDSRSEGQCSVRQRAGQSYAGGGAGGAARRRTRWRPLQAQTL